MSNQNKQNDDKGGINPVVAVITGAVIGAGVAVAGSVALKNEKNRNKVKDVINSAKNQAVSYMDGMQNKAEDKIIKEEKKLAESKKNVEKKSLKSSEKLAKK